jgi:hypothetical protein
VMALMPQRAAEFVGEYLMKGSNGRPDIVLNITAEGDKLWVEAPPAIPKQRFYVASDKEAFAATSPMLTYKSDAAGKPVSIQMNPTDTAVRRN